MSLERMGLERTRVEMSAARRIVELPCEQKFRSRRQRAKTRIPNLRPRGHSKLVKGIRENWAKSIALEQNLRHTIMI